MNTYLPHFSCGVDAYESIGPVAGLYGKKCALIYGEKAWAACNEELLPALEKAGMTIVESVCYGHEASFENVEKIVSNPNIQNADMLFAIGGGKCIDTVKCTAEQLAKPLFTVPTISSTCAAVTKISVMYEESGVFKEVVNLSKPPVHAFIHTGIIAKSPDIYLWAGVGDTLAKYIECTFSARGDVLTFEQEFGVNTSRMCFYPIIETGAKALEAKKTGEVSFELEKLILNIIISTGTVSITVGENYNSALAHAMNYGFSCRPHIEKNHLHGEVVSYGALLQLLMDNQKEDFELAYKFHKEIKLPTKLADLEIAADDPMEDILAITVVNKELEHVPYKVTAEMIKKAIADLEEYNRLH
ncbi:MAG: iron-containing alcohol dehydrogenase family protein [Erysipelotrichaceae bacterium]|nr:iron-containing alcohol dehydrogenase family protein [Erysipelotrichaceae bacterium]